MVAAFISVSWKGDLHLRVVGGLISLYDTAYGFGDAFYKNEAFAGVWGRFAAAFTERLNMAQKNLETEPDKVLAVFILTLICYKLAAWILKILRTGLLKKRPRVMKPAKKAKTGEAYNELYKQSKPSGISPSTQSYLEKMKQQPKDDEPGGQF
jgi:hypothetical protein